MIIHKLYIFILLWFCVFMQIINNIYICERNVDIVWQSFAINQFDALYCRVLICPECWAPPPRNTCHFTVLQECLMQLNDVTIANRSRGPAGRQESLVQILAETYIFILNFSLVSLLWLACVLLVETNPFFWTCRYFSGLCSSNIPRYFLDYTYSSAAP